MDNGGWITYEFLDDGTLDHVVQIKCKLCEATMIARFSERPTPDEVDQADYDDSPWCNCGKESK